MGFDASNFCGHVEQGGERGRICACLRHEIERERDLYTFSSELIEGLEVVKGRKRTLTETEACKVKSEVVRRLQMQLVCGGGECQHREARPAIPH